MLGENKEENLSECGGFMHNGTIDSTYFYQTWSLHRFCRSKNALYMSSVIVAVLVKPKEFTCTFFDRNLSLSKSKTATIFSQKSLHVLPLFFIFWHLSKPCAYQSIFYLVWFVRFIRLLVWKSVFTCNNMAIYIYFGIPVCIVTVIALCCIPL